MADQQRGRPVFVKEENGAVSIREVTKLEDGKGHAIMPGAPWKLVGRVENSRGPSSTLPRSWRSTDRSGVTRAGATKAEVLRLLLNGYSFYEVSVDDTIPSLFD